MKKFLTTFAAIAVLCSASFAGMLTMPTLTDVPAAGATVTNDAAAFHNGLLEGIYVDITSGASTTCTVTIATVGGAGAPPSRTLVTDTITADTYFPVRLQPVDTAGTAITANEDACIPLAQEKIYIEVTGVDSVNTNILDCKAYIYIR